MKLGDAIKRGLEQEGFAVDLTRDAEDGQIYAETEDYDLIVLDRMLPGNRDGLEICTSLREQGVTTPVLMLTARGELNDRVTGLNRGADDYLVKPFEFDELVARIRALLRRPEQAVGPMIAIGPFQLDTTQKVVTRDGQTIAISKREYALLEFLGHNPGQVFSKEQLIAHVWDFDADILPNTVEVFVRGLRKKLGDDIIETIRGFGYRLGASDV